jgi:O-antigen biosynthesis protein WbqP
VVGFFQRHLRPANEHRSVRSSGVDGHSAVSDALGGVGPRRGEANAPTGAVQAIGAGAARALAYPAAGVGGLEEGPASTFYGRTSEADFLPPVAVGPVVLGPGAVAFASAEGLAGAGPFGASVEPQAAARSYFGKRSIDVAAAGLILLAFTPLIFALWALVRLTSPGPGLHWSRRVGLNGRLFWMPKLRTMTQDAPVVAREALTAANDVTTAVGRFLRQHSLDELPQLWSILVGDMSFIGPRPLLPNDPGSVARRSFAASLTVRPGLSGLAQINGRNHVPPRRKARYDAFYAERMGLKMDLYVLQQTLEILFRRAGGGVLMH